MTTTILEQTLELQNSRLKSFLDFFPVLKDKTIQIDLKSIKDAASKNCTATLSKTQLDKIFKKDLASVAHAILPLYSSEAGSVGTGLGEANNSGTLSYKGEIEFYIHQIEIFSNCHNYERLDVVVHGAYNINNLHFFVKNIRKWLLCEDILNQSQQSKIEAIFMKHYFDQDDDYLNVNQKNFNQLSDFGFALQNWIESL